MWLIASKFLAFLLSPLSMALILFLFAFTSVILGARKSSLFCLVSAVIMLFVCSTPMLAESMVASLENQYPPKPVESSADASLIVMLGGAVGMPVAPRIAIELHESSDRVLHASRLYKAGKAPRIFVTAGNLVDNGIEQPEANYISRLLIEWGVPESAIVTAGSSRTTRENAIETYSYLDEMGILDQPVLLVTSAMHMPRSVKTFNKMGISVIPSTTDVSAGSPLHPTFTNWLPSLGALNAFTRAWHAYLGIWYYQLRGWA